MQLRHTDSLSHFSLTHTHTHSSLALTVSSATNEDVLMAITIAGQSSLKLPSWTSITGTSNEDVMFVPTGVWKESSSYSGLKPFLQLPTAI